MLPPCCAETTNNTPRPAHSPVAVITQYATADLIEAIAYADHTPADDPAWASTGAPTRAVYARWCRHMCGIACLLMALMHRDEQAPSLFQLLVGARHYGAYVQQNGGHIKGLIYAPFATYVRTTHGLETEVHTQLPMSRLVGLLDAGHMVMASVSKEIRRPENEPATRGGHLVLAIGHQNGQILFRNPSGHTPEAREGSLPAERFEAFFAGRGLSLHLPASSRRTPLRQPAAAEIRR